MIDQELSKKDKKYYENFGKRTLNKILAGVLVGISHLPFWVIYGISDFFYIVVRFVIQYRKKVIIENLTYAFPEKTSDEINKIAGKFYRHFCDLSLETIKLFSLSKKQINKHIHYKGIDLIKSHFEKGESLIVLAMHHNNWEWCSTVQLYLKHTILMIYNPLRGNQAFEKFLLKARGQWGGICTPVHKSARTTFEFNRRGKPTILWLAADQTPKATSQFWTMFLNREAPFFSGPEKIAKKTGQPVYFHRTTKVGRGHYEVEFTPLFLNPKEEKEKDILLGYVRKVEEIIRAEPEFYLWSHRRWKHKRPENIPLTT
ncbi:lysophospholipid acyltransferase family protein [Maribellus maritimus]|uniref:lysophospholipid acyltransferase family protein n=1 Tax=Maribellus maritimus TaxID=2870838 RepID=UPI001EEBAFA0|nr:lysophospholipid acyltransferase family protein [Maribellus maritimus]MCG6186488.1 lysophospholipid acyltransferase family protein [Maribellus maritimus]